MFANVPRGAFKSTLPFEYGTLIFSPRQVRSEQKEWAFYALAPTGQV